MRKLKQRISDASRKKQLVIDFGSFCTDIAILDRTGRIHTLRWLPSEQVGASIEQACQAFGVSLKDTGSIIVTGRLNTRLPSRYRGIPILNVPEHVALGYGAVHLTRRERAIIANVGTATSMLYVYVDDADTMQVQYLGGSGLGGATIQGLGSLILGTSDPVLIDRLARKGSDRAVHILAGEQVKGGRGSILGASTTSAFFAKVRNSRRFSREDLARAIVTLVGDSVATIAAIFARQARLRHIVVVGRSTTLQSLQDGMKKKARTLGCSVQFPRKAAYATVIGAASVAHLNGSAEEPADEIR